MSNANETQRLADHTLLKRMKSRFLSSFSHSAWQNWREEAKKCYEYKDGDQWSEADLKVLKKRRQPATVNNQVKVLVDYLTGQYVANRTHAIYVGRNTPADDLSHQTMTALKLFIEQNSGYEFEERDMFEDGIITGFGVLKIWPEYEPQTQSVEIKMGAVDCFEFYPDPFSREYDWNKDAKFLSRAKWVELSDAQAMWPDKASALKNMVYGLNDGTVMGADVIDQDPWDRDQSIFVDTERFRIRFVEQWWKEVESVLVAHLPDGSVQEVPRSLRPRLKQLPGVELTNETQTVLYSAVFTGDVILDTTRDPHKGVVMYPFVPYFENRKKTGQPYSFVSTVIPLQDGINKGESKALFWLTANQVIAEEGTITDKEEFATEMNRPDGIAEVKQGVLAGNRIEVRKNVDLAITQMNFHQNRILSVRQVSGINPDALGERGSPIRSGIGVIKKQEAASLVGSPKFDSLRRTKVIAGKLILEYLPRYYNGPMAFRITDDPKMGDFASKTFMLNMMDPRTNQIANVGQYAYDVVVSEIPNVAAMHQHQAQVLAQALPALSQMHPAWAMILIQTLDLKDKDKILELLQMAAQAPDKQKPNTSLSMQWDKLNEGDKNFFREQLGAPPQDEAGQFALGG